MAAIRCSLAHRFRHDTSVMALVMSKINSTLIFAGTHRGEILVYTLDEFRQIFSIKGHSSSVLSLALSDNESLLFSCSVDRIINVWCTKTLGHLHSIYSTYDIGDIFCIAYSSETQKLFLGCQNSCIQWCKLGKNNPNSPCHLKAHPFYRKDKFFDSTGPGGFRFPQQQHHHDQEKDMCRRDRLIEINGRSILMFAHHGYVYCMLIRQTIHAHGLLRETLISGGGDGRVKLWSYDSNDHDGLTELYTLGEECEEGDSILSMTLDKTFLYCGRLNGYVSVWDLETQHHLRRLSTLTGDVLALSFMSNSLFVSGSNGQTAIYDSLLEMNVSFETHHGCILANANSENPDNRFFVTAGSDGSVAVWNVSDDSQVQHDEAVSSNRLFKSLKDFIAFRSISSDPRCVGDCHRCGIYLRDLLRSFGAEAHCLNGEGTTNPLVYGLFPANFSNTKKNTNSSVKRLLFYGHYDVIPVDTNQEAWLSEPFVLSGLNGYLYGRGVSDNKGPVLAAVFAAADLFLTHDLACDVIFLVEGEEECGSHGLMNVVAANRQLFGKIDGILIANSYWLDDHVPCLTYGLRGVIRATVQIESVHPDLHSGVDGSRLLDEPLKDLVLLLSKLAAPHGMVNLPNFYHLVRSVSHDEDQLYDRITSVLLARDPSLGSAASLKQSLLRRWQESSLTIHEIRSSGFGASSIIPCRADATLSLRLVPDQCARDTSQLLIGFLKDQFTSLHSKNCLSVRIDSLAEPWLGDFHGKLFKRLERSIIYHWRNKSAQHYVTSPPVPTCEMSVLTLDSSNTSANPASPEKLSLVRYSRSSSPVPATSSSLTKSFDPQVQTNRHLHPDSLNFPITFLGESHELDSTSAILPLFIREGGSIPAVRALEKFFAAPAALLPVGQASDSAHLPNERLCIVNLLKSKDILTDMFRDPP